MKHFLILFSGVITILGFGSPYVLGVFAEKKLHQILVKIDKKTSNEDVFADVNFTKIDIKRGWFSSKVYIEGKIYSKNATGMILESLASGLKQSGSAFTIKSTIYHGPLLWISNSNDQGKLGISAINSKITLDVKSSNITTENIPIIIKSYISFLGEFSHTLMLPAHKQVVNNRLSFNCLDLDLDFHHSSNFSEYEINLDLDNLQITHKLFGKVVLKDVNFHKSRFKNGQKTETNRMFLADEIILSSVTKKELVLDDLSQEIVSSEDPQGISDISIMVSLNGLQMPSGEYGPISIESKWNNFNMRPFNAFIQKIQDGEMSLSIKDFFENIGKTITKNSIIELHPIKFQSNEGNLVINGNITPKFPWPDDLKVVKNIWDLTNKVNFNASASKGITRHIVKYLMVLEARKRLLKLADKSKPKKYLQRKITVKEDAVIKQINKWYEAGLLSLEDNSYNLEFKFTDDIFNLNGKVL